MKKIVYLFCIIFLIGCKTTDSEEKIESIKVSVNATNSESIFSDYSFIKLETNEECLLENIVKADISENHIYLLSSYGGNIYKFSRDGKFIWKLAKGNGVGELIFPSDFMFDESDTTLLVLDNYRTIKKYSSDGEFIEKEDFKTPAFLFERSDYGYIRFDPNLTTKGNHYLYAYRDSSLVFKGLPIKENVKKVGFMPSNVFVKSNKNNEYFIQHMLSDTIYKYFAVNNEIIPIFYIDTENKSVNTRNIEFKDSRSFHQICQKENLIPGISGLSIIGDNLYMMMYYREKQWYIKYDQKNATTTVTNRLCSGLPNSLRCVSREHDFIAYAFRPEELYENKVDLDDKAISLLKDVKIDDNPILILFN